MKVRSGLASITIVLLLAACSDPDPGGGRADVGADANGDGGNEIGLDLELPEDGGADLEDDVDDDGGSTDVGGDLEDDASGGDADGDDDAIERDLDLAEDVRVDAPDDVAVDVVSDAPDDTWDAYDASHWHDTKPDPDLGDLRVDVTSDLLDDVSSDVLDDVALDVAVDVVDDVSSDVLDDVALDVAVDVVDDADVETDAGGLPPDPYEPTNNTVGGATVVELDYAEDGLTIHDESDVDWFRFSFDGDGGVEVQVRFTHVDGDIDIQVFDGAIDELGRGISESNDEIVVLPLLAPGAYYLRVYGFLGATNTYDVRIEALPPPDTDTLFADLTVENLQNAVVYLPDDLPDDSMQVLTLQSYIGNAGTAGAPGGDLGAGSARFRLIDAETGAVVMEGDKGPVYFTNNWGCSGEAFAEWVRHGRPQIPGTEEAPTFTDPGCVDFYTTATNARTTPRLDISDRELVPDGLYYYELEVDPDDTYAFEADFARANNRGRVLIEIGSIGPNRIADRLPVAIQRSGHLAIEGGAASTLLGNGAALGTLGDTFESTVAIGAPGALVLDSQGRLLVGLLDDGSVVRREFDGSWSRLITMLEEPSGIAVLDNDDLVIVEHAANRLSRALASDDYATVTTLTVSGATLSEPTDARLGPDGTLYLANSGAHEVLAIDLDSGATTVVAGTGEAGFDGDGVAVEVRLNRPSGVDVRDDGLLVIAEAHNNRVRAVNLNDAGEIAFASYLIPAGEIVNLAGVGPTGGTDFLLVNGTDGFVGEGRHGRTATIDLPFAPRFAGQRLLFLDADNHRVRCLDEYGAVRVLVGSAELPESNGQRTAGSDDDDVGDGGSGLEADINRPLGLAVISGEGEGDALDLFIADTDNFRVRQVAGITLVPEYPSD